jgi:hypothetical protein
MHQNAVTRSSKARVLCSSRTRTSTRLHASTHTPTNIRTCMHTHAYIHTHTSERSRTPHTRAMQLTRWRDLTAHVGAHEPKVHTSSFLPGAAGQSCSARGPWEWNHTRPPPCASSCLTHQTSPGPPWKTPAPPHRHPCSTCPWTVHTVHTRHMRSSHLSLQPTGTVLHTDRLDCPFSRARGAVKRTAHTAEVAKLWRQMNFVQHTHQTHTTHTHSTYTCSRATVGTSRLGATVTAIEIGKQPCSSPVGGAHRDVNESNSSWPAVSQIIKRTVSPASSSSIVFSMKSTPGSAQHRETHAQPHHASHVRAYPCERGTGRTQAGHHPPMVFL